MHTCKIFNFLVMWIEIDVFFWKFIKNGLKYVWCLKFYKVDWNQCKCLKLDKVDWNQSDYRSSHQRCSLRKGVLRNFPKFTGKHLYQSIFFNKVARLSNTFFTEQLCATASMIIRMVRLKLIWLFEILFKLFIKVSAVWKFALTAF